MVLIPLTMRDGAVLSTDVIDSLTFCNILSTDVTFSSIHRMAIAWFFESTLIALGN